MNRLLSDADKLLALCESDYNDSTEYDLFVRCLSEQTIIENEKRRLRTKEDGSMKSSIMQNPSDPEATFRSKAGREHRGYAANLEYALHTTSFEEQPLSDKTLSRFRKRCYDYETLHNRDLYHDCVKDLSASIAKLMGISGKVRRMDSMMVESNIRRLSRMELIYTCIAKLVVYVNKTNGISLPDNLKHYTDADDFNRVIYHQRSTEADERMNRLLSDADKLLALCESDYNDSTEYDLFVRCLSEQTIIENEKRRLRTKEDGSMKSSIMQNPSDPEATFRSKAGREHRGYAANLEYALHTTSFEEQPLSDKTLSRFRKRCYDYETLHNRDLYHDCVKDLSASIAKLMGISGKVRRMDSMMVESNIRRLSRMELIYTCIAKLVVYVNKTNGISLPDNLKHYTDADDFNRVISA